MDVNGKMTEAELLDADKARSIYEEIVRKYKDPALLEYAGRDAFKVRIFPIEPNSRKQVKISYTQLLKSDTGLVEYTYPLNTEKFSARPLEDVSVKVKLACKEPIKSVYSPSHNVEIRRDGDAQGDDRLRGAERPAGHRLQADLLPQHRRRSASTCSPTATRPTTATSCCWPRRAWTTPRAAQVQKRDVCFVIDTSGSMAEAGGKKMEQAKKALSFCLPEPQRRRPLRDRPLQHRGRAVLRRAEADANKENVDKAQAFVQTLKPIGGTAIDDAPEARRQDVPRTRARRNAGPARTSSSS